MFFKNREREWFPVELLVTAYILIGIAVVISAMVGGREARESIGLAPAIFFGLGTLGLVVIGAFSKMSKRIDALEKLIANGK